ncbi:hypothetical protein EUGRSUZ_L03721 [Eucalyptus grandis]|uniref:Uncharacterized protein n=1 Tax=Eucalyptus grandis TaxID=71139 RepID=A0AAD9T852_EUCGR|nr:hypothetical protein EUGRSUZ_L03721 [Eucalyptus grandis]
MSLDLARLSLIKTRVDLTNVNCGREPLCPLQSSVTENVLFSCRYYFSSAINGPQIDCPILAKSGGPSFALGSCIVHIWEQKMDPIFSWNWIVNLGPIYCIT